MKKEQIKILQKDDVGKIIINYVDGYIYDIDGVQVGIYKDGTYWQAVLIGSGITIHADNTKKAIVEHLTEHSYWIQKLSNLETLTQLVDKVETGELDVNIFELAAMVRAAAR